MKLYKIHLRKVLHDCREIYGILVILNRRSELARLIKWAERKRLPGPRRAYQIKYDDTERRLFRHQLFSPRLVAYAHLLYTLKSILFPIPHYFPKGSASAYCASSLTKSAKSHSILYRLT